MSHTPTKSLCKCGESYAQADLKAAIDHALCDWPKPALDYGQAVTGTITTSIPRAFAHLSELRKVAACRRQR